MKIEIRDQVKNRSATSLLDGFGLGLEETYWQRVVYSPTTSQSSAHSPPLPPSIPVYCFPSLKNHYHQRQMSYPGFMKGGYRRQRNFSSMSLQDHDIMTDDKMSKPEIKYDPQSPSSFSVYITQTDDEFPPYPLCHQQTESLPFENNRQSDDSSILNQKSDFISRISTFGLVNDDIEDGIDFDEPRHSWKKRFSSHPSLPSLSGSGKSRGHKASGSISSLISGVKTGLKKNKNSKST